MKWREPPGYPLSIRGKRGRKRGAEKARLKSLTKKGDEGLGRGRFGFGLGSWLDAKRRQKGEIPLDSPPPPFCLLSLTLMMLPSPSPPPLPSLRRLPRIEKGESQGFAERNALNFPKKVFLSCVDFSSANLPRQRRRTFFFEVSKGPP